MESGILDTHLHVWDLTKAKYEWLHGDITILNRSYLLEEVLPQVMQANIQGAVLVQAANNLEDTALMLNYAQVTDWIKGIVGWLPLMYPDEVTRLLQVWKEQPVIKGVRHLIHNENDPAWLLQPTVLESLQLVANAGICFDLVGVNCEHLQTGIKVLEKTPGLKMVIDHLNQPPINNDRRQWEELIQQISTKPSVYAKISGLGTLIGTLDASSFRKVSSAVEYCLNSFGPQRCMLGSDWPVALLAGSYQQHWELYRQLIELLVPENQKHYLWRTAATEFYQLN